MGARGNSCERGREIGGDGRGRQGGWEGGGGRKGGRRREGGREGGREGREGEYKDPPPVVHCLLMSLWP